MRATLLYFSVLMVLGCAAGPAIAYAEGRGQPPACAYLGITHMHDMAQLNDDILQAQDKIQTFGALSCMDSEGQRVWFRQDGSIYRLDHMRIKGSMLF